MKCEVGPSLITVQPKERMQLCAALRIFCKAPQDTWIPFMPFNFNQCRAREYWKFLKSVISGSQIFTITGQWYLGRTFTTSRRSLVSEDLCEEQEETSSYKEKKLNSTNGNMECSSVVWCNMHLCAPAVSQWGLCNAFTLSFWSFIENPKSVSVPGRWNQSGLDVSVEEESENIF